MLIVVQQIGRVPKIFNGYLLKSVLLLLFFNFLECLSKEDCNHTMCDNGICKCKDELIKEGTTCRHGENAVTSY